MVVRDPKTGLFRSSKRNENLKPVKKGGRPKGRKDSRPRNLKHKRFKQKPAPVSDPQSTANLSGASSTASTSPAATVQPVQPVESSEKSTVNIPAVSDSEIFAHGSPPEPKVEPEEKPAPGPAPAPDAAGSNPSDEAPPLNEPGPEMPKAAPATPDKTIDPNVLANLVWGMELSLMSAIFGREMMPRKFVNPASGQAPDLAAGELPYDESEMVRSAWVDYLISLGVVVLSPLKALYLAHAAYLLPRMIFLVRGVRGWFSKKTRQTTSAKSPEAEKPQTPGQENRPTEPGKPEQKQPEQTEVEPKPGPETFEATLEQMR